MITIIAIVALCILVIICLLFMSKTDKQVPTQGNCPINHHQYSENNSLCCDGKLHDWNNEKNAFMTCSDASHQCRISPNNDAIDLPYCYSDNNVCSDMQAAWNVMSAEDKANSHDVFQLYNGQHKCNLIL